MDHYIHEAPPQYLFNCDSKSPQSSEVLFELWVRCVCDPNRVGKIHLCSWDDYVMFS